MAAVYQNYVWKHFAITFASSSVLQTSRHKGQHISGSPFSTAANLPVEKLGNPIRTLSRIDEPVGVAISHREEVVVTEGKGSNSNSTFSMVT